MELSKAIPRLRMAYVSGELVPFIGAGMSVPTCTTWKGFVSKLQEQCKSLGAPIDRFSVSLDTPMSLIQAADQAVSFLERNGKTALIDACRVALRDRLLSDEPAQTIALAKTYWPFVVTTNYDDIYSANAIARPLVLGRSESDCRSVLASLDFDSPPIVWALQGYLGGLSKSGWNIPSTKVTELANQVVVGHHQYQRVINNVPHFRRTFSEVFRRRSFLFMGSGLTESYILDLFGEVLTYFGPNPRPHFAFLRAKEAEHRAEFLSHRLNTTVITYDNHDDLPLMLDELNKSLSSPTIYQVPGAPIEQAFVFNKNGQQLSITLSGLPAPSEKSCVALRVGRAGDGSIKEGSMALSYLQQHHSTKIGLSRWHLMPGHHYVHRLDDSSIFGVAARTNCDKRDLRLVATSIKELVIIASELNYESVHVGLIAAGKRKIWRSTFSLIEMIRGVRRAASEISGTIPSLYFHIVDPSVKFPLMARKLPIAEILACEDVRFWLEINNLESEIERFMIIENEITPLISIAKKYMIPFESWLVEIYPSPFSGEQPVMLNELNNELNKVSISDFGVTPGGTLRFTKAAQCVQVLYS